MKTTYVLKNKMDWTPEELRMLWNGEIKYYQYRSDITSGYKTIFNYRKYFYNPDKLTLPSTFFRKRTRWM